MRRAAFLYAQDAQAISFQPPPRLLRLAGDFGTGDYYGRLLVTTMMLRLPLARCASASSPPAQFLPFNSLVASPAPAAAASPMAADAESLRATRIDYENKMALSAD